MNILDDYEDVMEKVKDIIGPYPSGNAENTFIDDYSKILRSINKNRKKIDRLEIL